MDPIKLEKAMELLTLSGKGRYAVSCKRDFPHPIPAWNLDLLREKYPDHRPPLPRETVDAWSVSLPPRLYEYLTEFSDTVYVTADHPTGTTVKLRDSTSPSTIGTANMICLDNYFYMPQYLDLATGKVMTYYYIEGDEDSEESDCWGTEADSFEDYVMKQFQAPIPDCGCPKCVRNYAINYNLLYLMSGMPGLQYSN